MSEITLTVLRLGMLLLLWLFVASVVGVLRSDLYGTRISRRSTARDRRPRAARTPATANGAAASAAAGSAAAPPAKKRRGFGRRPASTPTRLVVVEGPMAGIVVPLKSSPVVIGRSPECTLVLEDDFASGRHLRLRPTEEGWIAEDLGSTNGTMLGSARLGEPAVVRPGSVLRIGRTALELQD